MSDDTNNDATSNDATSDAGGEAKKTCLACDLDSDAVPLICLEYRGEALWICPRHMPLLIHQPEQLVGRLPGAESLIPGEPP